MAYNPPSVTSPNSAGTPVGSVAPIRPDGVNSGDVTLAGENYLTIAGQVITAHPIDLSGTNATGILAAGRFPALTGDVTTVAGSLVTTIKNDVNLAGNPTTTTQAPGDNSTRIATTAFVVAALDIDWTHTFMLMGA